MGQPEAHVQLKPGIIGESCRVTDESLRHPRSKSADIGFGRSEGSLGALHDHSLIAAEGAARKRCRG